MTLPHVRAFRIALGATASVAVSYAISWPLYYMVPLFVVMFLSLPGPWMSWKMAFQILKRLGIGLLLGLIISEFFLRMPLVCVPLYAFLFFWIYFKDATAPPLSTIFMTMGITMVPILGLQGIVASHFIASYLFLNMFLGFVFTWLFHLLIPNSLAKPDPNAPAPQRPPPPPIPSREERARLALVSTAVATSAVLIFFAFNLAQYALAMLYICMMAGTPNTNASIKVLKANSVACLIGGGAIIIAYQLLVMIPSFDFLIVLVLLFSLYFAKKMTAGGPNVAAWTSGFTTFLVLLGSSTGVDASAGANFYLRIAQILFAGLFCIVSIIVVENIIHRRKERQEKRKSQRRSLSLKLQGQSPMPLK